MAQDFLTDAEMAALEGGGGAAPPDFISDEEMARLDAGSPLGNKPLGVARAAGQGALQAGVDILRALAYTPVGVPLRLGVAVASGNPRALNEGRYSGEELEKATAPAIRPTETYGEAAAQGLTRGVVGAIPTLGMGTASAPLTLAASGLGSASSEVAREAGANPWLAGGIGLLTSLGVTGAGSGMAAAAKGRRGLDRWIGGREGAEIAAATEIRGAIGKSAIDDSTGLLREEVTGSLPGQARTAQVLADRAPGMVNLEARQARRFPDLQSQAAARHTENQRAVDIATDQLGLGGRGDLLPAWKAARDTSEQAVKAAYAATDKLGNPSVPTANLKQLAREMTEESRKWLRGSVPQQASGLLDEADSMPLSDLRNLRTALSDRARQLASAPGSSPREIRNVQRLKDAVDEELSALAATGDPTAPALRTAIETRAAHGRLFDMKHPAVKALSEKENPEAVVQAIAGSKRPSEEARRVLSAVGRDTEGHDGLKRLWMDTALKGKPLWGADPDSAIGWLSKNERASREILGDQGHELAIRLIERSRQLKFGRVGFKGMALSTGSGVQNEGEAIDAAASALGALMKGHPGKAASITAGKMWDWLVTNTTSEQRAEILNEALINPKRALELLTTVKPERFAQWQKAMQTNIARQTARSGAQVQE